MRTVATKIAEYKKVIVLSYCGSIHATQVFRLKTSLNTFQPPKPISNFCFAPPCRFKTVWYFISGFSLPLTLLVFIFFLRQVRLDINDVKDGQTEDLGGQRAMQCPFARDKRPLILSGSSARYLLDLTLYVHSSDKILPCWNSPSFAPSPKARG